MIIYRALHSCIANIQVRLNKTFFAFFIALFCCAESIGAQSVDSSSPNLNSSVNQISDNSYQSPPSDNFGQTVASTSVKTVFGAGGGLLGFFVGGLVGAGIDAAFWGNQEYFRGLAGFVIGAPIGYLFLEPAGVCLGADIMNERGSYWGAFLGNTAATLIGSGLVALIGAATSQAPSAQPYQVTIMITLPLGGSIWGYNNLFKPRQPFRPM